MGGIYIIRHLPFDSDVSTLNKKEKAMDKACLTLVIIGALNWLLVGIFQFDLVAAVFGSQSAIISRVIYSVIGLAGAWCIGLLFRDWKQVSAARG